MTKTLRLASITVGGFLVLHATLFAHHSFTAEFDGNKPVELKGTMSKVEWINPHIHLFLDVKDAQGKVTTWEVEGGPTRHMRDAGITKASVDSTLGKNMQVWGYPAKNGYQRVFLKTMFFPDGHFIAYSNQPTDNSGLGEIPRPAQRR